MSKKKKYLLGITLLIVIVGGYLWRKNSASNDSQAQYTTQTPEKGSLTISVSGSGSVTVDQSATVDPTITGTVANLAVAIGDQVEEGQFLFNIVNDELSVNSLQASASYDSALNSLESAKIDKNSAVATYEKALQADDKDGQSYTTKELKVLEKRVELAKDKVAQAEKSLTASLASYQNVQADAAERTVTSPISGTVNEINIANGDDLSRVSGSSSNAQAPIIIGDLSTLKAEIPVNEVDIVDVAIGQKATLTFDAISDFSATGKVEKIDSLGTVSSNVVTYNVTIGFDELDPRIKSDMSVSAEIITDIVQDALLLPLGAVKTQGDQSYVEILNNGSVPQKVNVEIGLSDSSQIEIKSGISESDKVVVKTTGASSSSSSSSNQDSGPGGGFRMMGF